MSEDAELLRQYAQSGSETAFAELVGRHLPLVYAAALRQGNGDEALAKDVAQTVFIDLARKANSLLGRELLTGWLYTSTRLAASMAVRGDRRRQLREQIAASMQEQTTPPESQSDQAELRLVLDEAMSELDAGERNAVLIRFFQGKELKEVGSALGISEDAARMRITRALANLQTLLKQRGVTTTTVALGTALATEAATAVPAGLAAAISAAAVLAAATVATTAAATATATAGATATVTAAATKAIAFTALQKAAIATLLAAAVGTGIYEVRQAAQRRESNQVPPQRQAVQAGSASPADPAQPVARGGGELPPVMPISLAGVLIPAENDQWDKNSAFKAIPRGKQVFGGVEFLIEGMIQLQSKGARDDQQNYRTTIVVPLAETNVTAAGTQVVQRGSNVAAVHLLGATRYGGAGECDMAQVVWRYADGSASTSHVMSENHVRDGIRQPYETPARLPYLLSKVVWRTPMPGKAGRWVRLYRFSYNNPEPGRVIRQIEFVSAMQKPSLLVVGLTLDPVRLGERPDDSPNLEPTDPVPGAQIEVMVQTTEGVPIPNARVRLQAEQGSGKALDRFEQTQITDARGLTGVGYPPPQDLQRLELAVSHADYAGRKMGWERQAGDEIPASYTFKLGNATTIGGRVVDESDAPITGTRLEFYRFWLGGENMVRRGEQSDFLTRSTTSDAQGLWQVKAVPQDLVPRIGFRASHPDYVGTNYSGRQSENRNQELRAGTFKVVLRRGSWVAGRVVDESGNPIAGATVTAGKDTYPAAQETKTDAQGAFGFRNLSLGEIPISALAKGRKPEIKTVEVKPGMPEILFRLGPGQKVWGVVKADTGDPLAGVRIALESKTGGVSDTYSLELKSGQDGRFEWDGAPEEAQNFCFLKTGYEAKRGQTLKPNKENVITLRHARKIEGRVLDAATEQPLTKFRVGIGPYSGGNSFYASYPGMKDYADANGRFTFVANEESVGAVKAEADDYAVQVERLPEAQNGLVQVVLRLKASKALHGVLVTPDGAPVAGGTVAISSGQPGGTPALKNARLVDSSQQGRVVTTDAAGEFVLPSPPETGTVMAADEKGFRFTSVQQVRDSGRLVLQAYGRIEGTYLRNGQPVAGQEFTISMRASGFSFDWKQYKATTDDRGRFTFDQVPPGAGQVMRLTSNSPNSWTYSYGVDVTVLSGQTAQVALGDSGAILTGRIRFESPPAEGEKLSLQGNGYTALPPLPARMSAEEAQAFSQSPEGRARSRQAKTFVINIGDDGAWNADSIPPGTYRITVSAYKVGAQPWDRTTVAIGSAQAVVPEGATPQTQISVDEVVLRPYSK